MYPIHHFVRTRPRLAAAILIGAAIGVAIPGPTRMITRALIGWNVAVWLYLCFVAWLMARAKHARVRKIAEQEDKSAVAVLAIMSIAAVASLAAIVMELSAVKGMPNPARLAPYAFTGATVFGSWCLVGVMFTFHYARMFYNPDSEQSPLRFPENQLLPDYWDFLYFSFTIAVAAQTSDITVMTSGIRKVVLAQSILSFFFNVAILGFSINIAAGLVGS